MIRFPKMYPPLFLFAWLALATGFAAVSGVLLFRPQAPLFSPLLLLSSGCIAFGAGEILNHPIERIPVLGETTGGKTEDVYRRRNPCSLGNLLDIGALLLFFVGTARLLYPH